MQKKITYTAKGTVLGNHWGGGRGAYPTTIITGNSIEEIQEKAEKALKDGSLDSGMGYESLIGAVLDVEVKTQITVDDKPFFNREWEQILVGELDEMDYEFLTGCNFELKF
jgi:hypothetical protein